MRFCISPYQMCLVTPLLVTGCIKDTALNMINLLIYEESRSGGVHKISRVTENPDHLIEPPATGVEGGGGYI